MMATKKELWDIQAPMWNFELNEDEEVWPI